jgi:hypothetical protein
LFSYKKILLDTKVQHKQGSLMPLQQAFTSKKELLSICHLHLQQKLPFNWCSTNTTTLEGCTHKLSFELMPSASITTQHAIELKNNNNFVIMPNLPSSTSATTIVLAHL